jgi:N-acyl-D-aspartate/D-glutamate deacylase
MSKSYELILRGGTVLDGSGGEPFEADIAIAKGKIAEVGTISARGREEIAAKGLLVTPGFVDIHTHFDGHVTWGNRLQPSSLHGATTVVMGNCGVGFAPCKAEERDLLIRVMEGVEDIPGIVMAQGVPFEWETFPQYLDFLDQRRCDVDFATQVPHGPVRVFVMGQRGADREPATNDDMQQMADLVREGVEAGALGFSTARSLAHRRKDGQLAPTITAGEEELLALARAMPGRGVIEMIDDFNDTTGERSTEFAMWRRIAEASGRPVGFGLAQVHNTPERWEYLSNLVRDANRGGLTFKVQVTSRPIGIFLGLDLSSHPFMATPTYRRIADLPLAERVARMRNHEIRKRILTEEPDTLSQYRQTRTVADMVEFVEPLNYFPPRDAMLGVRANALGMSPLELAYDVLLKQDGQSMLFYPLVNYAEHDDSITRTLLVHPDALFGIGDGGAHVGMICDASMTTHLLSYWTRDQVPEKRLPLPVAVQSLSRKNAVYIGLNDRGLVAPGYKADLNVIDYDALRLYPPKMIAGLPAGGRCLTQRADGYVATIVSGDVTYRDGQPTEKLPGRLIRGPQSRA